MRRSRSCLDHRLTLWYFEQQNHSNFRRPSNYAGFYAPRSAPVAASSSSRAAAQNNSNLQIRKSVGTNTQLISVYKPWQKRISLIFSRSKPVTCCAAIYIFFLVLPAALFYFQVSSPFPVSETLSLSLFTPRALYRDKCSKNVKVDFLSFSGSIIDPVKAS